jgi:hypothetical protein
MIINTFGLLLMVCLLLKIMKSKGVVRFNY